MTPDIVFTIGHSIHPLGQFIQLLNQHGITAVCDVRSKPYSRRNPQFNKASIRQTLKDSGIAYVFLGKELGARSEDRDCYLNGKVQFDRLAQTALFQQGVKRVEEGVKGYRLALMCAEKDPIECHRMILISRFLEPSRLSILHILSDGTLESHQDALSRLLRRLHLPERDMFRTPDEMHQEAYRIQSERIAYDEAQQTEMVEKDIN